MRQSSTITLYDSTANMTDANYRHCDGTFTFTGLTTGDSYTATVTSIGDESAYTIPLEGAMSSPLTLIPPQLPTPAAPTLSQIDLTSITVSYTPNPNAVSSTITLDNTTANTTTQITGNTTGTLSSPA